MSTVHVLSYFFGGAFATNAVPHLVAGLSGQRFQSPFAQPPGRGLSSAVVNFVWGFVNLIIAYVLLCRVGLFDVRAPEDILPVLAGVALLGLPLAWHFGRLNGDAPAPR